MDLIDLHCHSTASDGSVPPGGIPTLAAAAGLRAVALTDHDTTAGLLEFCAAGAHYPELETIPGVELSSCYGGRELHIVGLFINASEPALLNFLLEQRRRRQDRNEAIMSKLRSLGYPLSNDEPEFTAATDRSNLGRPHFARALVRRYGFASPAQVFDKLLGYGRPAYVRRQLPDPAAAIAAVHEAGGIAIWAHPTYRERNERAWLRRICKRFTPLGLDGIEGYYSLFGPTETALVTEIAAAAGLALSGGSDFHGDLSPQIAIGTGAGGLRVPFELLAELKVRAARRRAEASNHC